MSLKAHAPLLPDQRETPLDTRQPHPQNPWQITRANNTTHLYNPTLPTKSPPIFTPFFFGCVCGQTPMCPLKGPTLFFFGWLSTPRHPLTSPLQKGVSRERLSLRRMLWRVDWLIRQSMKGWGDFSRGDFLEKKSNGRRECNSRREWERKWCKKKMTNKLNKTNKLMMDGWLEYK